MSPFLFVYFQFEFHILRDRLYVTGLGNQQIILGFTWLKEMNPIIDWKEGTLEWRKWKNSTLNKQPKRTTTEYYKLEENQQKSKQKVRPVTIETMKDEQEYLNYTQNLLEDDELTTIISAITGNWKNATWINSKSTTATTIQAEINLKKEVRPIKEQIPEEFHEFLDVFSEEKATRFPEPRQWDHKIEMKNTFVPKSFKTCNLTPQEQLELDKFLKENLEKGYIRPSQSPMASPFFFVNKKDGKLRPCQDYRYL